MTTLSRQYAQFLADDLGPRVTPELYALVETCFVDTAACVLSGRDEAVTRHLLVWLEAQGGTRGPASLLFGPRTASVADAAAANGVAGHAIDFDDVALAGHPSVVMVPALLAEAERSGLQGPALVAAYLKGYQVWADLLDRLPEPLHEKGWHPTSAIGVVGVTAALCAARQLAPALAANALGLAASLAGGLVANFGSMTKPLHIGFAARHAVTAMELAVLGATASDDALDGATGYLRALAAGQAPDTTRTFDPQAPLRILTVRPSIKKYPVCYANHRVIDGALALRQRHAIDPAAITHIDAWVSPTNLRILKYAHPDTALQAKFSLQFSSACALLHGGVGLRELRDDVVREPALRQLMTRVRTHPAEPPCPLEPSMALHDRIAVTLRDGTRFDSGGIRHARGHAELPLSRAEVEAKLRQCVAPQEQALADRVLAALERRFAPGRP